MITIKKIQKSYRSYGRGPDNTYTPARYGIFRDEKQVGTIAASRMVRYMEQPWWEVSRIDDIAFTPDGPSMSTIVGVKRTFKEAKAKAHAYFSVDQYEVKS